MEEELAASLSSSSNESQRPPSPPIGARCGLAIVTGVHRDRSLVTRSQETVPPPHFQGNVLYRLYFKGLVSEETGEGKMIDDVLVGFGVAICDQRDNLLFERKGLFTMHGRNSLGAEIEALMQGLREALKLGIKHIAIYCDSFSTFQFVSGKGVAKPREMALLLDLRWYTEDFSTSRPVLMAGNDVNFAYRLARESIISKVHSLRQAKAARNDQRLSNRWKTSWRKYG